MRTHVIHDVVIAFTSDDFWQENDSYISFYYFFTLNLRAVFEKERRAVHSAHYTASSPSYFLCTVDRCAELGGFRTVPWSSFKCVQL